MRLTITTIVGADEMSQLFPDCLYSLRAQTRPPDDILVINNASTDQTSAVARAVPGVRVVDEPRKGLLVARETARRAARTDVVALVDADGRASAPRPWRIAQNLSRRGSPVAVTGSYRIYDWDRTGRALLRACAIAVAPPTHALIHHMCGLGAIFSGGTFAVRQDALTRHRRLRSARPVSRRTRHQSSDVGAPILDLGIGNVFGNVRA